MSLVASVRYAFNGTHPAATIPYGIGGEASKIHGFQARWDATFIGVLTVWTCDLPPEEFTLALFNTVPGTWIQQNPTSGYTAISPAGAATATNPLTISIAGGTAGGCSVMMGNISCWRIAVQVACSTPGVLAIRHTGKD